MAIVRFNNEVDEVEITEPSTPTLREFSSEDVDKDIYYSIPSNAVRRLLVPWETRLAEFRRPLQVYGKKKAGVYRKSMAGNPWSQIEEKVLDVLEKREHVYTLLHYCAAQRDSEMLLNILPKVDDVNPVDDDGKTPLHYAVIIGHNENVTKLMEKGGDPNIKDQEGLTACMYAACSGNDECLEVLFSNEYKNPGNATIKSNQGLTVLHYAALHEDTDSIAFLLENKKELKVNVDARNNNEETALHLAALSMNPDNVKLLLASGASVNLETQGKLTCFHYSAYLWDTDCLKMMLECPESSCFVNTSAKESSGKTALHFSCMKNSSNQKRSLSQVECVEYLVQYALEEIDVLDSSNITPLGYAAQHDKTLSAILIRHGADINGTHSRDPNTGNATFVPPLHLAAYKNHMPCLTFLLNSKNIEMNLHDYAGRTAVHVAVMEQNADALDTLLYFGAKSDILFQGKTPLQTASERSADLSRILIQYAIMAPKTMTYRPTEPTSCIFKPKSLLGSEDDEEIAVFYNISQRFSKKHVKSIFLLPSTQAFINLKRRMLRPLEIISNSMTTLFLIFGLIFLAKYGYCLSECVRGGDFNLTMPAEELSKRASVVAKKADNHCFAVDSKPMIWWKLLMIFTGVYLTSEAIELLGGLRNYLKNMENTLDMFLVVSYIILCPMLYDFVGLYIQQTLITLSFIITGVDIMLFLGLINSPWTTEILIFREMIRKGFIMICLFFPLGISFVLATYTLLNQFNGHENILETMGSLITYSVGAISSPFVVDDEHKAIQVSTFVLVMSFVFLVVLGTTNLLTGLAVNITEEVKRDTLYALTVRRVLALRNMEATIKRTPFVKNFRHFYFRSNVKDMMIIQLHSKSEPDAPLWRRIAMWPRNHLRIPQVLTLHLLGLSEEDVNNFIRIKRNMSKQFLNRTRSVKFGESVEEHRSVDREHDLSEILLNQRTLAMNLQKLEEKMEILLDKENERGKV